MQVQEASWANIVFTLVEASGLVALIVVGARDPDFGRAFLAAPHAGVLAGAGLIMVNLFAIMRARREGPKSHRPLVGAPRQMSRRGFFGRILGLGFGVAMLDFGALSIAFLWPNPKGGFGGKVVVPTKLGDINQGETMTMAPMVVRDKVYVGNSGGEMGVRGWLTALSVNDGRILWRAYSTGPDADVLIGPSFKPFYDMDHGKDLGLTSWPPDGWKTGGGTVWGWISYDPELDLIYYGTANPGPWNPEQRPGDNKWTSGIFARDPDTGEVLGYEARYVGTRADQGWITYNYNELNIVENGLLAEFRLAQQNLETNIAAGRGANFRYYGPGTGTSPLPITVAYFAGRTDAGVHAEGQVANFKTRNPIPPENLQRALNNLLPPSIRLLRVEEVSPDFHARWNAQAKTSISGNSRTFW